MELILNAYLVGVRVQPPGHKLLQHAKEQHDIGVVVNRYLPIFKRFLEKYRLTITTTVNRLVINRLVMGRGGK